MRIIRIQLLLVLTGILVLSGCNRKTDIHYPSELDTREWSWVRVFDVTYDASFEYFNLDMGVVDIYPISYNNVLVYLRSGKSHLFSIDAERGRKKWSLTFDGSYDIMLSPFVAAFNDKELVFVDACHGTIVGKTDVDGRRWLSGGRNAYVIDDEGIDVYDSAECRKVHRVERSDPLYELIDKCEARYDETGLYLIDSGEKNTSVTYVFRSGDNDGLQVATLNVFDGKVDPNAIYCDHGRVFLAHDDTVTVHDSAKTGRPAEYKFTGKVDKLWIGSDFVVVREQADSVFTMWCVTLGDSKMKKLALDRFKIYCTNQYVIGTYSCYDRDDSRDYYIYNTANACYASTCRNCCTYTLMGVANNILTTKTNNFSMLVYSIQDRIDSAKMEWSHIENRGN